VFQLIAALLQETAQGIDYDERTEIADMTVVIHCRPARIHADQVILQRMELLRLRGQSIKKLKRHEFFLLSAESSIVGKGQKTGQPWGEHSELSIQHSAFSIQPFG
jgi:hypothetical protein